MYIIYCCYGGAHSSPVAAAIHLGHLPKDRVPTSREILQVQYFDQTNKENRGQVLPVGIDRFGHRVFVCGRGREKRGIERAIRAGYSLAGGSPKDIYFVDVLPAVNLPMRLGGLLSRRLRIIGLGRFLVVLGTRLAYPRIQEIVEQTIHKVSAGN